MSEIEFKLNPSHYVSIGASAGGLEAIESFFKNMSYDSGMAFVVIQHLSPDYKSLMVELLSKHTQMKVCRAEDNMLVEANIVYLIPPKKNMTIFHGRLMLSDQDVIRGINLPIDIFMKSLAEDQGEKSIGIILSGTGSDGMRGIRLIKEHGGMVMVQSEESAKFDGMPKSAISTGMPDFILTPEEMPEKLLAFIKYPNITKKEDIDTDEDLTRIFALLRDKNGVDFTYYKPSTVLRRIERRMTVNQFLSIKDYAAYMMRNQREVSTLFKELLIGVTNFFRDKDAFDILNTVAITKVLKDKEIDGDDEIRAWVAGCSTGEEAYSMAISFLENMEKLGIKKRLKIFATDVDADAIVYAGNGTYPESVVADIPANILAKYFTKKDNTYIINRTVRELVVFAQQNIIKDPPFTKMDMISCRNLLIYLQPVLQRKVLEMFSFALNHGGFLFLGSSETIGDLSDCFEMVSPKWKMFVAKNRRKTISSEREGLMIGSSPVRLSSVRLDAAAYPSKFYENEKMYERLLDVIADDYVQMIIVVNEQLELIHSVGKTESFLKFPPGRMTSDITKLIPKDLAIPLATGLQKCLKSREEVRYSNININLNGENEQFRMRIRLLPMKKGKEPLISIFLEKASRAEAQESSSTNIVSYDVGKEAESRIADLEFDLQMTKESLQATIEELETSNEELQATNEELLASNEELQSTNEELQSVNEELYTVNTEYQNKITELMELNNDLDNLLNTTQIGTLFLDENLRIRKFTPLVSSIFRIIDGDIGRNLSDINHNILNFNIYNFVRECQEENRIREKEIITVSGKWFLMRAVPYHIAPMIYSGLTITFIGIDDVKKMQLELDMAKEQHISTEIMAKLGTWEWDIHTNVMAWSNTESIFGVVQDEFENTYEAFLEFLDPQDNCIIEDALKTALKNGKEFECRHRIITKVGDRKWIQEFGKVYYDDRGVPLKISGIAHDITLNLNMQSELDKSKATVEKILEAVPVAIGSVKGNTFLLCNNVMKDMTGYFSCELAGKETSVIYPDKAEYERVANFKTDVVIPSGSGSLMTRWKTKDGEVIDIYLNFTAFEKGNPEAGIVFIANSISTLAKVCSKLLPDIKCELQKRYGDG